MAYEITACLNLAQRVLDAEGQTVEVTVDEIENGEHVRVMTDAVSFVFPRKNASLLAVELLAVLLSRKDAEDETDGGSYFRVYGLSVGDVLTPDDAADIQKVLADYNDELGRQADVFHEGRIAAFREIGGDALVAAVEAHDSAVTSAAVAKALAKYGAQQGDGPMTEER